MKLTGTFIAAAALSLSLQPSYTVAQSESGPVTVVSHVDIKPDVYLPRAEETPGGCSALRRPQRNRRLVWFPTWSCRN